MKNFCRRYLEAAAKGEASEAVSKLMDMNPSKAVLVTKEGEGCREELVDSSLLQVSPLGGSLQSLNAASDTDILLYFIIFS